MAKSPTSKRCDPRAVVAALALGASVAACGGPATPVTAIALPETPRRPDGVVLEPPAAVPPVEEQAAGPAGVVALREPLGGEAATFVVRALLGGFEHKDGEALAALLTDDAVPIGAARRGKGLLLEQWHTRLKNLDYARLAGVEVVRLDRIERFSYRDLEGSGTVARPAEMKPGEILLRVPVATPRIGSEQLFGDVLFLVVRREGRVFKIAAFGEENGP